MWFSRAYEKWQEETAKLHAIETHFIVSLNYNTSFSEIIVYKLLKLQNEIQSKYRWLLNKLLTAATSRTSTQMKALLKLIFVNQPTTSRKNHLPTAGWRVPQRKVIWESFSY